MDWSLERPGLLSPFFAQRPLVDEPRAGRTGFAASLPEEPWREFKMTPV